MCAEHFSSLCGCWVKYTVLNDAVVVLTMCSHYSRILRLLISRLEWYFWNSWTERVTQIMESIVCPSCLTRLLIIHLLLHSHLYESLNESIWSRMQYVLICWSCKKMIKHALYLLFIYRFTGGWATYHRPGCCYWTRTPSTSCHTLQWLRGTAEHIRNHDNDRVWLWLCECASSG